MSYDLFFMVLADGVTANQINEYLIAEDEQAPEETADEAAAMEADEALDDDLTDEADEEEEEAEDEDEDEDGEPMIPERFMKPVGDEALRALLGKSFLRLTVAEEDRPASLKRYLESDVLDHSEIEVGEENDSDEWMDDLESMFEYASIDGMVPLMFSYGPNLSDALQLVTAMLLDLEPQRVAVYDPQLNRVVDATNLNDVVEIEEDGEAEDEDEDGDERRRGN